MKKFGILITILLISHLSLGQNIPDFESNTKGSDSLESIIFNTFHKKYDLIISFTYDCYWSNNQTFQVLGLQDQKWKSFRYSVKFKDRNKELSNILKTKIRKKHLSKNDIQSLLSFLENNNFWTLDNDSINIHTIVKDSSYVIYKLIDGCLEKFELISNKEYRLIKSYESDYFQEIIPLIQRHQFILCRNAYAEKLRK